MLGKPRSYDCKLRIEECKLQIAVLGETRSAVSSRSQFEIFNLQFPIFNLPI